MNWNDTIGQAIHAKLFNQAVLNNPNVDKEKLHASIINMGISVGITREAIADVLQAEMEAMAFYKSEGNPYITLDFLTGMLAATELTRTGKHVSDDHDS